MSNYWQHYRLEFDPFAADLAMDNCYLPAQWRQQLELLTHLSQSSNAVLLVTGLQGIGKSTLMRQFVQRMADSAGLCKIQGNESISPDVLRYLLAKHLDLVLTDSRKETFQLQLAAQLEKMQQSKQIYIIAIDDAHLLPDRTLAEILAIIGQQPQEQSPLHVVLFGGPQIEATIADFTAQHLGEGVTHTSRIKPLNQEQVEQYLQFRLQHAGGSDELPFNAQELADIYHNSGGIAAKINVLARECLETKAEIKSGQNKVLAARRRRAWMIGAAATTVGLFIVTFYLLSHQIKQQSVGEMATLLPDEAAAVTPQPSSGKAGSSMAQQQPLELELAGAYTAVETAQVSTSTNRRDVATDTALTLESDNEDARVITEEEVTTVSVTRAVTIAEVTPEPVDASANNVAATKAERQPSVQPTNSTAVTLPKPQAPQVVSQPQPVAAKPAQQKTAVMKTATEAKPVQKSAQAAVNPLRYGNEDQLLKASGKQYTLQLMGAYDEQPLKKFVHKAGLNGKVDYFHTYHNKRDWYVVIYGRYPTAKQAQAAISQLPNVVQQAKPWVRSIESVKVSINQPAEAVS